MNDPARSDSLISAASAARQTWDIVIVGAGMGGAATAYGLSKFGYRILVVEKGLGIFGENTNIAREESDPKKRLRSGRWPTQLTGVLDGVRFDVWAPLGSGSGGSTLLYAAALQRLRPQDFERQDLPQGGFVEWPFSYEELLPHYQQAEKLFSVRGSDDPLLPDPEFDLPAAKPMCERDTYFYTEFENAGLHPFNIHSGISYLEDCRQCLGAICHRNCKRDANNSLLEPALHAENVFLCSETVVEVIDATASLVKSVTVRQHDQTHIIDTKRPLHNSWIPCAA